LLLLLLLLSAATQQATAAPATDNTTRHAAEHVITYPSRLIYYLNEDSESTYHDLNTRTRNQASEGQAVHLAQVSFQLEAFVLSSNYSKHCYYHGQVRGNENSHAALSTCNGLHGMFDDGVHVYLIEPLLQTHSIVSYYSCRKAKYLPPRSPQTPLIHTYISDLTSLLSNASASVRPTFIHCKRRKRCVCRSADGGAANDMLSFSVLQMPRSVFEEMKYLEVMIVSDHSMYKRHKSKQHTRNFAKSAVNIVDGIFKEHLHTRVVLVAVEIWTDKDHIPISVRPQEMLRDFSKYRQQSIKHHADSVQLLSNVTFHYRRSSTAYFGGMCSVSRGVGVNEYGTTASMAGSLSQSLAQNLGIQWDPASKRKECGCASLWAGCIMEDNGVQHPQRFSKCSITDYKEFLLKGGGSCLFNRPTKLFNEAECGNGFVEVGEECDCGARADCYKECCKKCSLANGAHCSDGPCCNNTCLFYPRGYSCRYAVNDCDISETCSGDSGQCPPNLHKQDGYYCQVNKGRCYSGECKTRENQCKYIWGSKAGGSEKFCYEKLNTEGTEKGNFPAEHDGTPCGPSMMCLDRKCLPIQLLNMSTCPSGPNGQVCSAHGVCNNEATCTCDSTWAGTDCSMPDPPKEPEAAQEEEPKVSVATNRLIGAVAGTILALGVIFGGTGWGIE
uniref:ADAM metallopeptidase domain 23a n=1 Tax=Salarias fasciatus TaxID=181472 RepID=A0A672I385_SALFA